LIGLESLVIKGRHVDRKPGAEKRRQRAGWIGVMVLLALTVQVATVGRQGPRVMGDPVALVLRRFHSLEDPEERIRVVKLLGPIRDPRVTVVLMETIQAEAARPGVSEAPPLMQLAAMGMTFHHIPESEVIFDTKYWVGALMWWRTHEAEVRRRVARLPPW
jgi:hypothetical protein